MALVIDHYLPLFIKSNNFYSLSGFDNTYFKPQYDIKNNKDNCYVINWGQVSEWGINQSTLETGFFKNALHIDTHGLYQFCSLNLAGSKEIIENYDIPHHFTVNDLETKLPQVSNKMDWDGIVLAAQHPNDRSILHVGSVKNYYDFIEESCKFYGDKLLIKVHPTNNIEIENTYKSLAKPYGSTVARTAISVIDKAEFMITYNSTFSIDCILRNKLVNQYAPGYFWKSGIVNYTERKLLSNAKTLESEYFHQFYNFLLWKYCFHANENITNIRNICDVFKNSSELFPLPENLSYGQYLLNKS